MQNFSIINPNGVTKPKTEFNNHLFAQSFYDLKLSRVLQVSPVNINGSMINYSLAEFLTDDIDTIKHRLDVFEDLQKCRGLFELLRDTALPAISNLSTLSASRDENEYYFLNQLYSVKRLTVYVECIECLHKELSGFSIRSRGITDFAKEITALYTSREFIDLKENMEKINLRFKNIKSITVGINIGDGMQIDTMGIVSINEESYKSGRLLDRLLSADFLLSEEFSLLTPLEPVFKNLDTAQKFEANRAFKSAFDSLLRKTLRNVPKDVSSYMRNQTQFMINLLPEMCFLIAGHEMLMSLKSQGMSICKPEISTTRVTSLTHLYHPQLLETTEPAKITRNSVTFDGDGMFYVLSGANSGGKSVFLHSVGIAQILFQLGLYVPATEASMLPVDYMCLQHSAEITTHNSAGRLEQECIALNQMLKVVTKNSLILVDEAFSSTSAYDGSLLAEELLKHFARIGCRGVFSTHIHDLPIERINSYPRATIKVDTLMVVTADGTRTYRVERQKPDGLSHAQDIARKYGLLLAEEETLQ